jgi:hypothetical protein
MANDEKNLSGGIAVSTGTYAAATAAFKLSL